MILEPLWPRFYRARPWRLVGTVLLVLLVWGLTAGASYLAHVWAAIPHATDVPLPEALQSPMANPVAFLVIQLLLLLGLPVGSCAACCGTCCSLPVVVASVAVVVALLVLLPY
eukprot:GGOE01057933.1.p3 GENE.GGOE01057933.1~~GGOE01057933.1.p3  ORF type:complete len:113 (-),score=27.41 GGOE01057933.1:115-453(-)